MEGGVPCPARLETDAPSQGATTAPAAAHKAQDVAPKELSCGHRPDDLREDCRICRWRFQTLEALTCGHSPSALREDCRVCQWYCTGLKAKAEQPAADDACMRRVRIIGVSGATEFGPEDMHMHNRFKDLKLNLSKPDGQLTFGTQILQDSETLETLPAEGEVELTVVYLTPCGDLETLNQYQVTGCLGSGTFSTVFQALCLRPPMQGQSVAIKRMSLDEYEDGIPGFALREISLLRTLNHPNVVKLLDVHPTRASLFMVLELLDMNLHTYIRRHGHFSNPRRLREASLQCFQGLLCCHLQRVLHRDLKPQNILVVHEPFQLKIADFGLSREFRGNNRPYTPGVVTLWYRSPELLLGETRCGPGVDIWSMACILSEMASGAPLFPGDSEIDTIYRIFRLLGTPNEQVWPGVSELPYFHGKQWPQWRDTHMEAPLQQGPALGQDGGDLLRQCLAYVPDNRPTVRRLVRHNFFQNN